MDKKDGIRWRRRKQPGKDPSEVRSIESTQTLKTAVVPPAKPKIRFSMEALPEDWEALYYRFCDNPELLGSLIFINFIEPVYEKKILPSYQSRPRGSHAIVPQGAAYDAEGSYMWRAKAYAAAAHAVLSYWLDKPEEKWPKPLKKQVRATEESLDKAERKEIRTLKGRYSISIVMHLAERKFGQQRKKLGLFVKNTWQDFRHTYLQRKSNPYMEAAEYFFKERDCELTISRLYRMII
jgi:hypothetical protein